MASPFGKQIVQLNDQRNGPPICHDELLSGISQSDFLINNKLS
jgi:hypothetical protein